MSDATEEIVVEWNATLVKASLADAADTLTRIPSKGAFPSKSVTMQIDVVRDFWEAYGRQPANVRRGLATPEQIALMDEALTWLLWLTRHERKVVWARAMGMTWRELQDALDRSDRALQGDERSAIEKIVRELKK